MKIFYYPSFLRQLKKLPKSVRADVMKRTKIFIKNPRDPLLALHKLAGRLTGLWSFSIDFRFRIVCEIKENEAFFHAIGDHSIYE